MLFSKFTSQENVFTSRKCFNVRHDVGHVTWPWKSVYWRRLWEYFNHDFHENIM